MTMRTPGQIAVTGAGTVTTGATTVATERGDDFWHYTGLALTAFAVGTIPDNAAARIGAKFYTLPAGDILVEAVALSGGLTGAVSVTAQTPEVGIGSVVGSGAAATLSTTFEDYIDGGAAGIINGSNTAPDLAGTTFRKGMVATSAQGVLVLSSGSHDMFLNAAATWADVTAAGAATFTGVISFRWRKIN
jgi:hypothetical protein